MSSADNIVVQLSVSTCGQKNPPQPSNMVIIIWQNLKTTSIGRRSNYLCFLLQEVVFLHSFIQLLLPFPFFTSIFAEKIIFSKQCQNSCAENFLENLLYASQRHTERDSHKLRHILVQKGTNSNS